MIQDFSAFDPFIRNCLQHKNFYRFADPLADVIVYMAEEEEGFLWHFDTNNFTFALAIQSAEEGDLFVYAPNIRAEGENFPALRAVLVGASDLVRSLVPKLGDLQIFKGRYSLYRVTALRGATPRYVAIFS